MNIYKILVFVLLAFLFVQCQKDDDLGTKEYLHLMTKLNIDYNADTVSMGDTIWVNSRVVGFLTDSASGDNIHFRSAKINVNLNVRAWNLINQNFDTNFCSFEFTNYTSFLAYTNKSTMVGAHYTNNEGVYHMKFGVIFHTPGTYSIDTDYLKFRNYYSNKYEYFGGGLIEYYDLNEQYKAGYIIADIITNNHNIQLYNSLSDDDKNSFQTVDETNESKYFFIKVNE